MSSVHGPTPYPCASCPYRCDVPSGVWDAEEYAKLPGYDKDTPEQPASAFMCHQQNDHLCSGWVGCHDMQESFGLRLAISAGVIGMDDYEAALDYECPVPLFPSGAAAAAHGLAQVANPPDEAKRTIAKIEGRRARRSNDAT